MNKKNKLKFFLLLILLLSLVIFVKTNDKRDRVVTIPIRSSYMEELELAKSIIEDNREYIIIDRHIEVNPVIYELYMRACDNNYDEANSYFIKEDLRREYIEELCEINNVSLKEEEFIEYKKIYLRGIKSCRRESVALFNGFTSFEEYIESDDFRIRAFTIASYDKLASTSSGLDEDEINLNKAKLNKLIDLEVEKMYREYKNKKRY